MKKKSTYLLTTITFFIVYFSLSYLYDASFSIQKAVLATAIYTSVYYILSEVFDK